MFRIFVIIFLISILVALGLCLTKDKLNLFITEHKDGEIDDCTVPDNAKTEEYRYLAKISAGKGDLECSIKNWHKVVEKAPLDVIALANLAMNLTQNEQHDEALPYYEKAIKLGVGGYDTFAWYARSLKDSGNYKSAIEWYYRTLSVAPELSDIPKELTALLVTDNRHYEALGVLTGLNNYLGRPKFKDSILSLEASMPTSSVKKVKFRVPSIQGHFYLPVKLSRNGEFRGFMVDTGASFMTFDWVLLAEDKVNYTLPRDAPESINLQLADGGIIEGKQVTISEVQIGPFSLENVQAVACAGCALLIGQNMLKEFETRKKTENGLEFIYLAR